MDHPANESAASRRRADKACSKPGLPKTAPARDVMPILAQWSASPADVDGKTRAPLAVDPRLRAAPAAANRYEATTPRRTRPPHLALASNHPRQSGRSAAAARYQPSE